MGVCVVLGWGMGFWVLVGCWVGWGVVDGEGGVCVHRLRVVYVDGTGVKFR